MVTNMIKGKKRENGIYKCMRNIYATKSTKAHGH